MVVSAIALACQVLAYIALPLCLSLFSSSSISAYSVIVSFSATVSIALTFYCDNALLSKSSNLSLKKSLAFLTSNLFILSLVSSAILLSNAFEPSFVPVVSSSYFAATLLALGYLQSVNKVLSAYLITISKYRLSRFLNCLSPLLALLAQFTLFRFTSLGHISSLVAGLGISLVIFPVYILASKPSLKLACKLVLLRGTDITSSINRGKKLASTYRSLLLSNSIGTLGIFLSSLISAFLPVVIISLCGVAINSEFYIASRLLSPVTVVCSLWIIPKILAHLSTANQSRKAFYLVLFGSSFVFFVSFLIVCLVGLAPELAHKIAPFKTISFAYPQVLPAAGLLIASQQLCAICTLHQITRGKTSLILFWQLTVFSSSIAVFLFLAFSNPSYTPAITLLFISASFSVTYLIWAATSARDLYVHSHA